MKKSSFYRLLWTIVFPIMIQYFITSSLNFMDTLMIGSLGEEAVAALGIANQYFFVFNLIVMGIYSGCNVLISQFWGKKDIKNIRKVLGISLVLGVSISLIFAFFGEVFSAQIIRIFDTNKEVVTLGKSYLQIVCISYVFMGISFAFSIGSRGVQRTFLPMTCSAIALVLNIFFNYVFIFGHFNVPAMGVKGAALATLISRTCEMILIISLIYGKKDILSASFKELIDFDKKFFNDTMKVTVPVVINELCWGVGMVVYSIIYGHMGTKAIASVQICTTIQNMFLIILFAISNGACVMIGNEVGRGDFKKAKLYSKKIIKIGFLISLIMAAALVFSSKFIMSFYNVSSEVYTNTIYMLLITAFILPVRFINVVLIIGILRGGGDASYVLKVELATMWLVGVPLCLLGAFFIKLLVYQVFLLVTVEDITKCIIAFRRYKSYQWIKNVVDNMQPV